MDQMRIVIVCEEVLENVSHVHVKIVFEDLGCLLSNLLIVVYCECLKN